jgi:hypothetical protein
VLLAIQVFSFLMVAAGGTAGGFTRDHDVKHSC